jgi:large subunit ribosomal protein L1
MAEEKKTAKKASKKAEKTTDEKVEKKTTKAAPKAEKKEKVEKATTKKSAKVKLKKSEKQHGKKYREVEKLVEKDKEYSVEEAIDLAKKTSTTKFDSSVEVHIRLNIDIQNSEQQVRGSVVLPKGTGKSKKVLAIVGPGKESEAKNAGADFVGGDDMIAKIEKGWLDFEVVVATPDMMPKLGKIGKILGTKGLMPNPKIGTVTNDIAKAVEGIKKGMVEYRPDKAGIIHVIIGKVSFNEKDLTENYKALTDAINKAKPSGVKGTYVKGIALSTSMGPGIKVGQK